MTLSEPLIIFIVGEIIGLGIIIWKFATAYGKLLKADEMNNQDINNIAQKGRKFRKVSWQRLNNIENFLIENHHYVPPSLNLFEEDEEDG